MAIGTFTRPVVGHCNHLRPVDFLRLVKQSVKVRRFDRGGGDPFDSEWAQSSHQGCEDEDESTHQEKRISRWHARRAILTTFAPARSDNPRR